MLELFAYITIASIVQVNIVEKYNEDIILISFWILINRNF